MSCHTCRKNQGDVALAESYLGRIARNMRLDPRPADLARLASAKADLQKRKDWLERHYADCEVAA